jgi:REP element-mobilizing transposase RayT
MERTKLEKKRRKRAEGTRKAGMHAKVRTTRPSADGGKSRSSDDGPQPSAARRARQSSDGPRLRRSARAPDGRKARASSDGKRTRRSSSNGWGGRRANSGRKPAGEFALNAHEKRPTVTPRSAVLVTLDMTPGLPSLTGKGPTRILEDVFAAADGRFGLQIVQHSILRDHVHLIVKARNARTLSRGMKGLQVRFARRLNGFWGREGNVFADRFEARVLDGSTALRSAKREPCSWRRDQAMQSAHRPATCRELRV